MAEVTAFRNNALPYPVYGVPWTIVFPLLDADGDPVTGATCDSEVSKNGDTGADCTNEGTEIPYTTATNKGMYYLTLTATEMTADIVTVTIYSATSKATCIVLYPRKLVELTSGTSQGGAAGYITLAASTVLFNGQYNGCLCVATIDSNVEARVLQVCTASNQQCTVTPSWNVTPDSDDTYKIYLPEGMQFPTANVKAISDDTTAADNAELEFDGTGYAGGTIRRKVDIDTIKTQAITAGAGVTVGAFVGNATAAIVVDGNGYVTPTAASKTGYSLANGSIITATFGACVAPAGFIAAASFAAGAIDAAAIANGAIDAATFAADVDAEILSYLVDDATRIDASALNTASVTTIPAIYADTNELQTNQGNWVTATGFSTHSAADVAALILVTPAQKLVTDASGHVTLANGAHGGAAASITLADYSDFQGAAGDPWDVALPGAYAAGKAGYILGTNLDAVLSARTLAAADYFDPATDAIATVTSVTNGVTLASGAVNDASLAGNLEIVFETDFATNYNTLRNAWVTNVQDFSGITGADPFGGTVVAASVTAAVTAGTVSDKTGYSLLETTGLGNQTANIDGSVGSVTGGINTAAGTIQTLDALDAAQDAQHAVTQAELAKVPKSDGSVSFNVTALAAIGAKVEAMVLDEGDATALLAAIAAKIETFLINEGDATATIAAIATACNAAVEAGQVGVDAAAIAAKLPSRDYLAGSAAATGETQTDTAAALEADPTLNKLDSQIEVTP